MLKAPLVSELFSRFFFQVREVLKLFLRPLINIKKSKKIKGFLKKIYSLRMLMIVLSKCAPSLQKNTPVI
jgi:hypothetical protein